MTSHMPPLRLSRVTPEHRARYSPAMHGAAPKHKYIFIYIIYLSIFIYNIYKTLSTQKEKDNKIEKIGSTVRKRHEACLRGNRKQ